MSKCWKRRRYFACKYLHKNIAGYNCTPAKGPRHPVPQPQGTPPHIFGCPRCCPCLYHRLEAQSGGLIEDLVMLAEHMCGVSKQEFMKLPQKVQPYENGANPTAFGDYYAECLRDEDSIYIVLCFLYWVRVCQRAKGGLAIEPE